MAPASVTTATVPHDTPRAEAHTRLREAINQTIGSVFFGPLLKTMRSSPLKSTVGHGGRGEDIFRAQLDGILAERAGTATQYELGDVLFDRLARAAEAYAERE